MTNQIVLKLTVTKRKYITMSKKLIYGGIEVTPNDPRLPEILASIVELIQKTMGKQVRYHFQHINGSWERNGVETIRPSTIVKVDDGSKSSLNLEQEYINSEQIFAFLDEGTIHINKDGMSVADCLKQPGFKVVDDEGD